MCEDTAAGLLKVNCRRAASESRPGVLFPLRKPSEYDTL